MGSGMWRIEWHDTLLNRQFSRGFATNDEATNYGRQLVVSDEAGSFVCRFINFPFKPEALTPKYPEVEEYYGGDEGRILDWLNRHAVSP